MYLKCVTDRISSEFGWVRLILGRVIDIKSQCTTNPGYTLQPSDIETHEGQYGQIGQGTIVLIRTGWHRFYPAGPVAYLGFDEAKQGPYSPETSVLTFPGIGTAAARVLVERRIAGVGLDTGVLVCIGKYILPCLLYSLLLYRVLSVLVHCNVLSNTYS